MNVHSRVVGDQRPWEEDGRMGFARGAARIMVADAGHVWDGERVQFVEFRVGVRRDALL